MYVIMKSVILWHQARKGITHYEGWGHGVSG